MRAFKGLPGGRDRADKLHGLSPDEIHCVSLGEVVSLRPSSLLGYAWLRMLLVVSCEVREERVDCCQLRLHAEFRGGIDWE